jgi:hypothetical protein
MNEGFANIIISLTKSFLEALIKELKRKIGEFYRNKAEQLNK